MNTLKGNLVPDNIPPDTSVLPQATVEKGQEVFHSIFQKRGIITDIDARKNRVRLWHEWCKYFWADKRFVTVFFKQHHEKNCFRSFCWPQRATLRKILSLTLDVRGQRAVGAYVSDRKKYIWSGRYGRLWMRGNYSWTRDRRIEERNSWIPAFVYNCCQCSALLKTGGDGMTIVELK